MCSAPKIPPPPAPPEQLAPPPAPTPGAGGGGFGTNLSPAAYQAGPGRISPTVTRTSRRFGEAITLRGKQALVIPAGGA